MRITGETSINKLSYSDNELMHYKYIKREKVNGKWRYYYPSPAGIIGQTMSEHADSIKSNPGKPSKMIGTKFVSVKELAKKVVASKLYSSVRSNNITRTKAIGQSFVQKKLYGTSFRSNSAKSTNTIGSRFSSNSASSKKLIGRSISNKVVGTRFESNSAKRQRRK